MRIGFLGPAGTFSEQALLSEPRSRRTPSSCRSRRCTRSSSRWRTGRVDRALVPIENSLEGSVNEALDALVHDAHGVRIVGERVLPVRYCLIARPGVALQDVRGRALPSAGARAVRGLAARHAARPQRFGPRTSTAEAVREVAATDDAWAALGTPLRRRALRRASRSRRTSRTSAANATRFVWLAREGDTLGDGDGSADWKTSVVFSGDGDGSPGWLVRCLVGVRLPRGEPHADRVAPGAPAPRPLRLPARPRRAARTSRGRPPTRSPALSAHCEELRVLGSYPRAAGVPIP